MGRKKILKKILAGSKNIRFAEFQYLVEGYGFSLKRVSGSHHIYTHPDLPSFVNIQDVKGEAKIYQVYQFLKLVEQFNLNLGDDE